MALPRLLLIDDENAAFERAQHVFEGLARVEYAPHARAAIELLASTTFDLVLLDQQWTNPQIADRELVDELGNLPALGPINRDEQGRAILRFLTARSHQTPIYFFSKVRDHEMALRLCREGARDFLAKADVYAHPEWVLHLLSADASDRAVLRRLLRRSGVVAGRDGRAWLLSQRKIWGRQWSALVGAIVETATRSAGRRLSPGAIIELERETLPALLEEYREAVNPIELRRLLDEPSLTLRPVGEGLWLGVSEVGDRTLAIVEPAYVLPDNTLRLDWDDLVKEWPSEVRTIALGPNDPYWGGPRLLVASISRPSWCLDAAPPDSLVSPWPIRSGRVGQPGAAFWQSTLERLRAIQQGIGQHAAVLPGLLGVALPDDACTEGRVEILSVPRNLLASPLRAGELSSERLVLQLHRGVAQVERLADSDLESELAVLPTIEVRRSVGSNPFEEEVLSIVLEILGEKKIKQAVIWAGCDFLHVRRARQRKRLSVHAREYDLVVLTRHGLLVLECKESTRPEDFEHGHTQVKTARADIWASGKGHDRGGVYLLPVLMERLQGEVRAVPEDLLGVLPDALVNRLRGQPPATARTLLNDYYDALGQQRHDPAREPSLEDFESSVRNGLPVVVGFVVAPEGRRINYRGRGSPQQTFVLGIKEHLPRMLRGWFDRQPIFTDVVFDQVRSALAHMSSAAETDGAFDLEGFKPDHVDRLGSWRRHFGQGVWAELNETWLVRGVRQNEATSHIRQGVARWFSTVLSGLSGDLRWLDRRGQLAVHPRNLHRFALKFQGRLLTATDLCDARVAIRLGGAVALVKAVLSTDAQTVLGVSREEPFLIAQELLPGVEWRWGWMPGWPLSRPSRPSDARTGLRRALTAVAAFLAPGDDPALVAATRALDVITAEVDRTNQPRPLLERLLRALRAALELS